MFLVDCSDYGSLSLVYLIKRLINITCAIIPIILIIVVIYKLVGIIFKDDDLYKVVKPVIYRSILAMFIFMLPSFVTVIINMISGDLSANGMCWEEATVLNLESLRIIQEAKDAADAEEFERARKSREEIRKEIQEAQARIEAEKREMLAKGLKLLGSASMSAIEYVQFALDIAADDTHGYSQDSRGGNPDYDCSSLVYYSLQHAGYELPSSPFRTAIMYDYMIQAGFEDITSSLSGPDDLVEGDILLRVLNGKTNLLGHTEIYIGDNKRVGAHNDYDGSPGDGNGQEISVADGVDLASWDYVFRDTR